MCSASLHRLQGGFTVFLVFVQRFRLCPILQLVLFEMDGPLQAGQNTHYVIKSLTAKGE